MQVQVLRLTNTEVNRGAGKMVGVVFDCWGNWPPGHVLIKGSYIYPFGTPRDEMTDQDAKEKVWAQLVTLLPEIAAAAPCAEPNWESINATIDHY